MRVRTLSTVQRRLAEWRPRGRIARVLLAPFDKGGRLGGAAGLCPLAIDAAGRILDTGLWDMQDARSDATALVVQVGITGSGPPAPGSQMRAAIDVLALLQDRFSLPVSALDFDPRWPAAIRPLVENAVRLARAGSPSDAMTGLPDPPSARRHFPAKQELHSMDQAELLSTLGVRATARTIPGSDTLAQLRPHLINLWGRSFSTSGAYATTDADIDRIFGEDLPRRVQALPSGARLPLVLYAHGGLVDEEAGLSIAANQIPWFNANGCYPLHFIWETGLFESIEKMLGIQREIARDISDVTDAVIETSVRALGGPAIWGNMKNSAASAFEPGAAGSMVAEKIVAFARANPKKVVLHAVGHSAGSIFHAHFLQRLDKLDAPPLETLTLMAPAITTDAYIRLVEPLTPGRVKRLRLFAMRKEYELRDTVTPLYRKSLLYLIHYALESRRSEPLLGLEKCLRENPTLAARFGLSGKASSTGSAVFSVTAAGDGANASKAQTHGGFDNDVATMNSVMRGIVGIAESEPLKASFPPDTEQRSANPLLVRAPPKNPAAESPPTTKKSTEAPTRLEGPAVRRALCIGIDAYPAPNGLHGCVADSEDWAAALTGMGFAVEKLQNADASHAAIVARLKFMIESSRSGDSLVLQYAGHGTKVPDLDGDETGDGKAGQDQAICPIDFEDGKLLIDDDIRAILDQLPAGVRLTCFMDNCHSGTTTRFLVGRSSALAPASLARFVVLTPEVRERYISVRRSINAARENSGGRRSAGAREQMRWVAFAACRDDESAFETNGHGAFTSIAAPLLRQSAHMSNKEFFDGVTAGFGADRRQNPVLDCRDEDMANPLIFGPASIDMDRTAGAPGTGTPAPVMNALQAGPRPEDRARDVANALQAIARLLQ